MRHSHFSRDETSAAPQRAVALATPVSRSVPRLADFRLADRSSRIAPAMVAGALRAFEFCLIAMSGLLVAAGYVPEQDAFGSHAYLIALIVTGLLAVLVFEALGLYRLQQIRQPVRQIPRLVLGFASALALLATSIFFLKIGPDFSRGWLALWFATGVPTVLAGRLVLAGLTRSWARQGRLNRRAVVYGTGPVADDLIRALEADPTSDIRICGVFDADQGAGAPGSVRGYPVLGTLADLVALARKTRIDLVVLALPLAEERRIEAALKGLFVLPVDIRLAGKATRLTFRPRAYSYIGNVPLIDVADRPIAGWGMVGKWVFDKAIALAAIVLLAPVLAAIALAVRLDSRGPVLFRQKRYGFNNELIEVLKFRSMYVDRCDADARQLVSKGDPRVTPVGRFIRRTSLDELPQLFNVLRGDLSLVGPRPHALQAKAADKLYDEVVDSYFARHRVKPGITGWAQVNGWRGETDTPEKIQKRVEHDLYYIDNWSLFLDVYILLKTPLALLRSENAY